MSNLILNKTKEAIFTIPTTVAGFFKCRTFKKDLLGREYTTNETPWMSNLILNTGLDLLGNSSSFTTYCFIGSGTNVPVNTDTQLQTLIASNNTLEEETVSNQSVAPFYTSRTKRYRFNPPGGTGRNINEIGIGPSNSGLGLFSRLLTVDVNNVPTTVTQQADEYLDVIYQNNLYMPVADYTTSVTDNSILYNLTARPAYVNNNGYWTARTGFFINAYNGNNATAYAGGIVTDLTSGPAGSSSGASTVIVGAYSTGTYNRSCTYTFGLSNGNITNGINSFLLTSSNTAFQVGVAPAIPKDINSSLQISLQLTWARYP